MAYITISAGWNANHQLVAFLNEDKKNKRRKTFYQENEKPRVLLIDRKGAASIDSYADQGHDSSIDSSYGQLHSDPSHPLADILTDDKFERKEETDEQLVEKEVVGWDGDVEVHRAEDIFTTYGWSKLWDKTWSNYNRNNLIVLPELHMASPPELTSFQQGSDRISESKYLDQVEEDIRVMAEECDRIEGFVYLTDACDGFAGVSDKITEFNSDEYGRKSIVFSIDEPWSTISPYSLICQSLCLQNSSSLHIPICNSGSSSTESQRDALSPILAQALSALEKVGISQMEQFLVPFQQRIISTYSADVSKSLNSVVKEFSANEFESCFSWTKSGLTPFSRDRNRRRRTAALPRVLTTLSIVDTSPTIKTKPYYGNAPHQRSADDTVCMWYNTSYNCAAQSIITENNETESTQITSLRNSNEIHGYIAQLVTKVARFSPRLTGFEQDDWVEKLENLETIRDQTRDRTQHSTSSSDSDG